MKENELLNIYIIYYYNPLHCSILALFNFQNDLMKFKLFKGALDANKNVPAGKLHNSAKKSSRIRIFKACA